MSTKWLSLSCLISISILSPSVVFTAPPYPRVVFKGVGDLPGGAEASYIRGLSADGLVAVGMSSVEDRVPPGGTEPIAFFRAFRWTDRDGIVGLGDPKEFSLATASSHDGAVIVGYGRQQPRRWNAASEAEIFSRRVTTPSDRYTVFGLSSDGSLAVGQVYSLNGNEAHADAASFTIRDGSMSLLGDLAGGEKRSHAWAVSGDGTVIVGYGTSAQGKEAFRWTRETGMVGLGNLPGAGLGSEALGVSADGKVVVGQAGRLPFRWTSKTGMIALQSNPTSNLSGGLAYDASADGSVIVGTAGGAMVWDAQNGMRQLEPMLVQQFGVDLTGWKLRDARAVSDDGLTIAGDGIHNDKKEGWVVRIELPPGKKPVKK